MPVTLESINIRSFGPFKRDHSISLGQLNLIYGGNERGKTLLVEFLLRSLFSSSPAQWDFRNASLEGTVTVRGLPEVQTFSPRSRKKLDALLCHTSGGLPQSASRLLVIKGADLAFIRGKRNAISRAVLKEYLSGSSILDSVQSRISPTLMDSTIENSMILGPNSGEIRHLEDATQLLRKLDTLREDLDHQYSTARQVQQESTLASLQQKQLVLDLARRFQAFTLSRKICETELALEALSPELLLQLNDLINEYGSLQKSMLTDEKKKEGFADAAAGYHWLRSAVQQLEAWPASLKHRNEKLLLIPAGAAILAAVTFLFLDQPLVVLGAILAAVFFSAFFFLRLQAAATAAVQDDQYQKILRDFRKRFPDHAENLASMRTLLESLHLASINHSQIIERLGQHSLQLTNLQVGACAMEAGDGSVRPIERVTLDFEQVEWTYTEFTADGRALADHRTFWDLVSGEGGYQRVRLGFKVSAATEIGRNGISLRWLAETGRKYRILQSNLLNGQFTQALPDLDAMGDGEQGLWVPRDGPFGFFIITEVDEAATP